MKNFTLLILALSVGIGASARMVQAQFLDPDTVRYSEAALAFSSGSVQKTTPRDGIVNLITGDNQTTGNRMLLGKRDVLYLKLENPTNVAVGDLYTVYRRVRKAILAEQQITCRYNGH